MTGARAAAALAVAAAGCGHPAAPRPVVDQVGLSVVVYAARDGDGARAYVDDRRWIDVPADGEVELAGVASTLELASVVVESASEPGRLTTRRCQVVSAAGIGEGLWLIGRQVDITTAAGAAVTGTVEAVGEPFATVDTGGAGPLLVPLSRVRLDPDHQPRAAGPLAPGDPVVVGDSDSYGRLRAIQPGELVVRGGDRRRHAVRVDAIARVAVDGVAAEPAVRCRVATDRPGRHLVRLSYATAGVAWWASYRAELPAGAPALDQLEVTPVFELDATGFAVPRPAQVRLYAGLPGGTEPPVLAWEGDASLGGGRVQVMGRPSSRRARVDRVFRGAVAVDGGNPRSASWRDTSTSQVWRELAFERSPADVPGPIRVAVAGEGERRWIDGAVEPPREPPVAAVRVPLWIEPDLIGYRRKVGTESGGMLVDQISYSVANHGGEPVTVVVEEELRGVARARVVYEEPAGRVGADRWQTSLQVAPGQLATGAVAIRYRLRR